MSGARFRNSCSTMTGSGDSTGRVRIDELAADSYARPGAQLEAPDRRHSVTAHGMTADSGKRIFLVGLHPKRNTLHDAGGTVRHQTPSRTVAAGPSSARTRSGSSAVFVAFKSSDFMTRLSRKSLNSKPRRLISTSIAWSKLRLTQKKARLAPSSDNTAALTI